MKVKADGSLAELSKNHPDVTFRILTSLSTDGGHITLVEVEELNPEIISDFLENDPDVLTYEVLSTDDRKAVIQYLQDTEPAAGQAGRESGNPPPYPLILTDGWLHVEAIRPHDRLSEFRTQLDDAGVEYELLSVTQTDDAMELLTDRQRNVVLEALERGYYDTPRRCTLTDLAEELGVNKATASGILHRAEGAIIKEFMAEPGTGESRPHSS